MPKPGLTRTTNRIANRIANRITMTSITMANETKFRFLVIQFNYAEQASRVTYGRWSACGSSTSAVEERDQLPRWPAEPAGT